MEATNAGGGNVAPQTDAAQTEFKAPEGKVLIDTHEYERYRQNSERVRGMQPYWERGSQVGFKRPEDFESYGKFAQVLKSKGLSVDQVAQILSGPEKEESEAQAGGLDISAIEKHFESKGYLTADKLEQARSFDRASFEHERAIEKEAAVIKSHLDTLLGENPSPRDKYLMSMALKAELSDPSNRDLYPSNHPLHDKVFAPLDEKSSLKLIEKVKKSLAINDGEDAVKAADAAIKGRKVSTPAGSSNNAPNKSSKSEDNERRPGNLPPKSAVEAEFKKRQARRDGGQVSSIAG
jgi:DNA-binding transcriptional MerR regulator